MLVDDLLYIVRSVVQTSPNAMHSGSSMPGSTGTFSAVMKEVRRRIIKLTPSLGDGEGDVLITDFLGSARYHCSSRSERLKRSVGGITAHSA